MFMFLYGLLCISTVDNVIKPLLISRGVVELVQHRCGRLQRLLQPREVRRILGRMGIAAALQPSTSQPK